MSETCRKIYQVNDLPLVIPIGVQSEKGVEEIRFDVKPWLDAWDGLELAVYPTRPGESAAYPAADVELIGTVLYWYPNDADTAIAGEGKVEIVGVTADKRKLSGATRTVVAPTSMSTTQEPPEGIAPWYEGVMQAAKDVKTAVDAGEGGLYLVRIVPGTGKADRTVDEILAAAEEGKTILLMWNGRVWTYYGQEKYSVTQDYDGDAPTFYAPARYIVYGKIRLDKLQINPSDGDVHMFSTDGAKAPNPYKLTLTGAVEAEYDGSKSVTVDIPDVLVIKRSTNDYNKADHTPDEIRAAFAEGKACIFVGDVATYIYYGDAKDQIDTSKTVITFYAPLDFLSSGGASGRCAQIQEDGEVLEHHRLGIEAVNPHKLFIGGKTYDGSETVSVLPAPADATATAYLRWNGTGYVPATIDQLKADLGLA